jgi:phosphate-selective porin OprO/OprP
MEVSQMPPTPLPDAPASASPAPVAPEPGQVREIIEDPAAEPAGPTRKYRLDAGWDTGLRFASPDDQFHIHVGGNAQIDSTWLIGPHSVFALPGGGANGIGNASATFLRRARFRLDGDIFDQFDYIVEYDFANAADENSGLQPPSFGNLAGEPAPANVWMQVRDLPLLGNVRFGNQVKPIGMTNNTYQGFLPFLERADNMDAFYGPFDNGFALGLTARNRAESERLTWQFGGYRPSINVFGVGLNKFSYGGRVTALPVYEDDGRRLVHVGFGTFNGQLPQNELRLRARPLLRNGPGFAVPVLVDTGEIPGNLQYTLAPELALVLGPWTVQAEWTGQYLTHVASGGLPQGTVFFNGGYTEVLYFLTGEYQQYDKANGVFGRVVPRNNFHWKRNDPARSFGAWQLGARFSYLDLNDKAVQGGLVYNWTAGVNWYLNPNMKLQFNYILEHRDQPGATVGWINGLGVRGAYDF